MASEGPSTSDPSGPRETLARADELVEQGAVVEAIRLLQAADRLHPDPEVEIRLVDLRHQAVAALASAGRSPWPPVYDDPFPEVVGRLPELPARDLTPDRLGGAVAHHGALVVRGLFGPGPVAAVIDAVGRAEAQRGDEIQHGDDHWYRPFAGATGMDRGFRRIIAEQGGIWLADSPAATALVLDLIEGSGALAAIEGHFGERPLFTLQKSTLRRSAPVHNFAGWHQDGSFLGARTRAMNVWVALTDCGGDIPTPALEIVPRRVGTILDTDGGLGSASISDASVLRAAGDTPPVHPGFAAGDALLFDERLVHRTHLFPGMTHERLALECWFFAPAFAADDYVSFVA